MAHDSGIKQGDRRMPFTSPWPLILAGWGSAMLALLVETFGAAFIPLRVLLVVTAVLLALGGVSIRLRQTSEDVEERFKTAGFIWLAGAVPFLCGLTMNKDWDTASLLLGVFVAIAIVGGLIVLLPRLFRRLLLTVLVVIHFAGMFTAFASVPPPGGQSSWLVNQAWVRFYRPYLNFIYMVNAYHFYSPEPGPPSLLWFYIVYEDGSSRWVEIPNHQESPTRMAYQRRLALTESANQLQNGPFENYEEKLAMRVQAGRLFRTQDGKTSRPDPIPDIRQPMFAGFEYRVPTQWAKKHIASYARYVAKHFPSEEDPSLAVKRVKVYRATHSMVGAAQLAPEDPGVSPVDPFDPTMYLPYYQGEFDKDGNLLDADDPFLYWLIPIIREPLPGDSKKMRVVDYVKIHANGSKH
jgi:hypothetical protein